MNEAITIGYNYLKFFVDLAAGTVDNNYNYPAHTIDRQQPEEEDQSDNSEQSSDGEEVVIE